MTDERLSFNVAHLNPELDLDNPDAVHLVAASHLKEYLTVFYGEDVPVDLVMAQLTEGVLGSLAMFSTDEEMNKMHEDEPFSFIPYWLRSFTPVVDKTKALGKRVGTDLLELDNRNELNQSDLTNDLSYGLGIFDLASFAIARELEIPHPRYQHENLIQRSRQIQPPGYELAEEPDVASIELITRLPIIKAEYRRKIIQLRIQGQKIVDNTEIYTEQFRHLVERTQA